MADLPGHSVAITCMYMYTTKLKKLENVRDNFKHEFLDTLF